MDTIQIQYAEKIVGALKAILECVQPSEGRGIILADMVKIGAEKQGIRHSTLNEDLAGYQSELELLKTKLAVADLRDGSELKKIEQEADKAFFLEAVPAGV